MTSDAAQAGPSAVAPPAAPAAMSLQERRGALVLLFIVGALNLFDRQIINVLANDIKTELGLSDMQLGLLTGTAFGIFYSVMGIPLGRLADRMNRVRLISATVFIWSLFTVACGLATNFVQLFLARMLIGVGEAGSQPASTSLVHDIFPEKRRSSAMSLLLLGAPVGSFLGLLLGGWIGSLWGWRTAFVLGGLPGFLVALVVLLAMRDPVARKPRAAMREEPSVVQTTIELLRRPGFVWLALGNSFSAFLIYTTGAWLPAFFIRVHGLGTAEIGSYAALAVGLGGAIGLVGAGLVADGLRARIRDAEAVTVMTVFLLTVPALLTTLLSPSLPVALIAMFLFHMFLFANLSPTVTLTQRAVRPETKGLAVAVSISASSIFGLSVGLPLVGTLSDVLAPLHGREAIRYALMPCALVGLAGAAAHLRARALMRGVRPQDAPGTTLAGS